MNFDQYLNEGYMKGKNFGKQDADYYIDGFLNHLDDDEDRYYMLKDFLPAIEKKYGKQKELKDLLAHWKKVGDSIVGNMVMKKIEGKLKSLKK